MEKLKQRLLYIAQVIVAAGLMIFIFLQIDRDKFIQYFSGITFIQLLMISPLSLASLYIQFLRWRYVLNSFSVSFDSKDVWPSFFAGLALRLLVPGGHAEVSKIYMLPGKKRGKAMAFGMERFFQTLIKVIMMTLVVPVHFPQYSVPVIIVLVFFVGLYLAVPHISFFRRFYEKDVYYHRLFTANLSYALILFLIMVVQYYILLNGVKPISLWVTGQTVVYLWGAGVVPVTISGLGVREGLAAYFLAAQGFAPAYAVATSLFLFTLNNIFPAFYGAYVLYRRRAQFKDIKQTWHLTKELWKSLKNGK